jgi:toxin ParE1/3/4
MPKLGSQRTYNNPTLRKVRMLPVSRFKNFLVFYRLLREKIEVIRILHTAHDLAGIFDKEKSPA